MAETDKAGKAEREKPEDRLADALKRIGEYTDANCSRAVAFAEQLAKETSLTRDQAMAVEIAGIQLGNLSGAPLENATKAAVGWAERMHVGPDEAMRRMMTAERPEGGDERRTFEPHFRPGASLGAMNPQQRRTALLAGGLASWDAFRQEMPGRAADFEPTDVDVEAGRAGPMRGLRGFNSPVAGTRKEEAGEDVALPAGGRNGVVSAHALPGTMPGAILVPDPANLPGRPAASGAGGLGIGGSAEERAADALETYLPMIANNTRKSPRDPYQVTQ